ncbi:MAG: zinc-ribbon domain-containing protein [Candidatus Thorarchaeota archaeon]
MVYCQKCGTENPDVADFCKKCGAPLAPVKRPWREKYGGRAEEECFGVTGGGAICGILFGIVIIALGFSLVYGIPTWIIIGPIVGLVVGVLIIICALNSVRRKRIIQREVTS